MTPPPFGVHLGATAAAVGVRLAAGSAAKTVKLKAARGAYRTIFSDRARLRFRRFVFGSDAKGSGLRVALVMSVAGTVLYFLVEPVEITRRRRLMLFDLEDEMRLGEVAAADLFQAHSKKFLPSDDARARRVAAVAWQLVNRLDFEDIVSETDHERGVGTRASADEIDAFLRRDAKTGRDGHPLFAENFIWTVHVLDDPTINAFTCPGGYVFIHSGVLDMVGPHDDSALAFIIAREMGHCLCRHGVEKATLEIFASLSSSISFGLAALAGSEYFGGAFSAAALVGAENAFSVSAGLPNSRAMEREADLVGIRLMERACFDSNGAARVFRMLDDVRRKQKTDGSSSGSGGSGSSSSSASSSASASSSNAREGLQAYLGNAGAHTASLERSEAFKSRTRRCAEFRDAVRRCTGAVFAGALPPNASARNEAKVMAPSSNWRLGIIQKVDARIAGSPRGVTGALGRKVDGGHYAPPVGSGPVGRFDTAWLESIIGSGFPGFQSASSRRVNDRARDRSSTDEKQMPKKKKKKEKDRKRETPRGETISASRGWRGPVRRARETASLGEKKTESLSLFAAENVPARERRLKPERVTTLAGIKTNAVGASEDEKVFGGDERWDRGARRALRSASRAWKEVP